MASKEVPRHEDLRNPPMCPMKGVMHQTSASPERQSQLTALGVPVRTFLSLFLSFLPHIPIMEGHDFKVGQTADQEKEEEKPSIYPSQKQVGHLKTVLSERGEKI